MPAFPPKMSGLFNVPVVLEYTKADLTVQDEGMRVSFTYEGSFLFVAIEIEFHVPLEINDTKTPRNTATLPHPIRAGIVSANTLLTLPFIQAGILGNLSFPLASTQSGAHTSGTFVGASVGQWLSGILEVEMSKPMRAQDVAAVRVRGFEIPGYNAPDSLAPAYAQYLCPLLHLSHSLRCMAPRDGADDALMVTTARFQTLFLGATLLWESHRYVQAAQLLETALGVARLPAFRTLFPDTDGAKFGAEAALISLFFSKDHQSGQTHALAAIARLVGRARPSLPTDLPLATSAYAADLMRTALDTVPRRAYHETPFASKLLQIAALGVLEEVLVNAGQMLAPPLVTQALRTLLAHYPGGAEDTSLPAAFDRAIESARALITSMVPFGRARAVEDLALFLEEALGGDETEQFDLDSMLERVTPSAISHLIRLLVCLLGECAPVGRGFSVLFRFAAVVLGADALPQSRPASTHPNTAGEHADPAPERESETLIALVWANAFFSEFSARLPRGGAAAPPREPFTELLRECFVPFLAHFQSEPLREDISLVRVLVQAGTRALLGSDAPLAAGHGVPLQVLDQLVGAVNAFRALLNATKPSHVVAAESLFEFAALLVDTADMRTHSQAEFAQFAALRAALLLPFLREANAFIELSSPPKDLLRQISQLRDFAGASSELLYSGMDSGELSEFARATLALLGNLAQWIPLHTDPMYGVVSGVLRVVAPVFCGAAPRAAREALLSVIRGTTDEESPATQGREELLRSIVHILAEESALAELIVIDLFSAPLAPKGPTRRHLEGFCSFLSLVLSELPPLSEATADVVRSFIAQLAALAGACEAPGAVALGRVSSSELTELSRLAAVAAVAFGSQELLDTSVSLCSFLTQAAAAVAFALCDAGLAGDGSAPPARPLSISQPHELPGGNWVPLAHLWAQAAELLPAARSPFQLRLLSAAELGRFLSGDVDAITGGGSDADETATMSSSRSASPAACAAPAWEGAGVSALPADIPARPPFSFPAVPCTVHAPPRVRRRRPRDQPSPLEDVGPGLSQELLRLFEGDSPFPARGAAEEEEIAEPEPSMIPVLDLVDEIGNSLTVRYRDLAGRPMKKMITSARPGSAASPLKPVDVVAKDGARPESQSVSEQHIKRRFADKRTEALRKTMLLQKELSEWEELANDPNANLEMLETHGSPSPPAGAAEEEAGDEILYVATSFQTPSSSPDETPPQLDAPSAASLSASPESPSSSAESGRSSFTPLPVHFERRTDPAPSPPQTEPAPFRGFPYNLSPVRPYSLSAERVSALEFVSARLERPATPGA
eukprot:gnl/Chilomastix_cuspidata/6955.p1 GENE.gnl/Chilomastix_cuspidata/6955~~gnl/Chilomastix_cuspidata/6955.p1  ORF type:complete len:1308 (+),score=591.66 gnl/Chilomastix_cuspidata/6955:12-3935(+)